MMGSWVLLHDFLVETQQLRPWFVPFILIEGIARGNEFDLSNYYTSASKPFTAILKPVPLLTFGAVQLLS